MEIFYNKEELRGTVDCQNFLTFLLHEVEIILKKGIIKT